MPKVKKEVVKQEVDQAVNPIPTFREIDDVIFRNIAYFINLNNKPLTPNKIQGANSLYQGSNNDLIKFSHVCKKARQAALPYMWHTLVIHSLPDFRCLMKIYNHACLDKPRFEQVYGVHVKCIDVWIGDSTEGIYQASLYMDAPEKTYQDLVLVLSNLAKHFSNLNSMRFSFLRLPIPKTLTSAIDENCVYLRSITLATQALADPFDGNLPRLRDSISEINFVAAGFVLMLTSFSFTPFKDDEAPFGFRLTDNDKIYSYDQIAAIRIVQLCATGLQYRCRNIILPYNEAFFTCSSFWSIWTWVRFNDWHGVIGDDRQLCRGWIGTFKILRCQLIGMNVRSVTLIKVKEIRGEFLSRNDIKLILAKSPLSSLAGYQKMNLDEGEIQKRLEIINLLHIFAKLESDLDLLKTIIKAKDEVGRFAK